MAFGHSDGFSLHSGHAACAQNLMSDLVCMNGEQGIGLLTEEGAALMAGMRAVIVGQGAPGTTTRECRRVSPTFLADCNEVLPRRTAAYDRRLTLPCCSVRSTQT